MGDEGLRCHYCMFATFIKTAKRKEAEWASVPSIARTHASRRFYFEAELEILGRCRCGEDAHPAYARRRPKKKPDSL